MIGVIFKFVKLLIKQFIANYLGGQENQKAPLKPFE